jgi:hypothetical protein
MRRELNGNPRPVIYSVAYYTRCIRGIYSVHDILQCRQTERERGEVGRERRELNLSRRERGRDNWISITEENKN